MICIYNIYLYTIFIPKNLKAYKNWVKPRNTLL